MVYDLYHEIGQKSFKQRGFEQRAKEATSHFTPLRLLKTSKDYFKKTSQFANRYLWLAEGGAQLTLLLLGKRGGGGPNNDLYESPEKMFCKYSLIRFI